MSAGVVLRNSGGGGMGFIVAQEKLLLLLLLLLVVAACQTVPTTPLKSFSESMAAVGETNKAILADLALPETRHISAACLHEAAMTASTTDPPRTATEAGMEVLQIHTGTLSALVSDGSSDETSAQLKSASNNLLVIGAALTGLSALALAQQNAGPNDQNPPSGANLQVFNPTMVSAVAGAIMILAPLLDQAAAQPSRAEARQLIMTGEKQVHVIVAAERDSIRGIWCIHFSDWQDQIQRANPKDPEFAAAIHDVETWRAIMSDYYVVLDQLDEAWTKTVAAIQSPQSETMAALTDLTEKIKAESNMLAKAYAALRSSRKAHGGAAGAPAFR
jgi:hypothetical protein